MSLLYIDIETDNTNGLGLDVFKSRVVTIQILLPSGKTIILKDPKSLDNAKSLLENNLIVGHDLKFDSKILKYHFGVTLYKVYDVCLAETIISGGLYKEKQGVTGLNDLGLRYFGQQIGKQEQKDFRYRVPLTQEQKQNAANDLKYLSKIYKQQQAKIKLLGLENTVNIEMRALPAIVWLELSGIYVDTNKLKEFRISAQNERDAAEAELYNMLGTSKINLNSTQQLVEALNNIGIPVTSTKKEELAKFESPVLDQLKEYKRHQTLLNTFIDKILSFINYKTGRIHANYCQIGTATGRLSCKDPNMQQQPSRQLKDWKEIFVAEEGNKIITADYSQIELRIVGQAANDKKYIDAYNTPGVDLHKSTAAAMFNISVEEVTSVQRSIAKSVNFGLNYGMSAPGLVTRLKADTGKDITIDEAKTYIKGFWQTYPEVTAYLNRASIEGTKNNCVHTAAGRLLRFNLRETKEEHGTVGRQCKNYPIQGLCADIIKIAMRNLFLKLEPMGVKFIATVHDELVFEFTEGQAEEVRSIVKEEMEKAGSIFLTDIPCVSEVFINDYWHKD